MDNKEKLTKLVQRFEEHLDDLKHKDYKEMQLCTDYINPLFAMLGWDIENERDSAEKFRDVVQQYRLAIGSTSKAPDYLFRIGGTPVFFVEAKKPSVDINSSKDPAFQLRRYGWNKKEVDISILTDFEDFSVYNCQIKPQEGDEPHVGRIARYNYKQYLTHWDEIGSMFSRASVERGSLDKLLKEKSIKGIKETVDESFLKMIEDWRDMLARNLALRNPELDVKQLNYAVQQTIDRIIFLRIAEDRGIEEINQLLAMTNGSQIYGRLIELFKRADQRYNSGLFHFVQEKAIKTPPDNLSLTLSIDDKVLKDMIVNLYPPKSPYDFSAMPADILGQVYERFLGKVIRLTDGHRAVVDEKPEVRKAGGVYYTPTYIVDYIVQNTVGKLVEGKTPAEVAKLRILDPACGSGSFLIGAYQFLLDWHIEYYKTNDPEKHAKGKNPPICQLKLADGSFGWKLTTEKRKEVLLNNIFGVDIDRQAVEVTKLNLLLKVLEEGHVASLIEKMQRALPDLGSNIKCGNSLIESDFFADKQGLFDTEEEYRINTFDWDREFPEMIKWKDKNKRELAEGFGFDAVIGNPPYIFTRNQGITEQEKIYYYSRYIYQSNQLNTFGLFFEKCFNFLKNKCFLSFITPNNWLTINSFNHLRKFIVTVSAPTIINISDKVFQDANVDTAISILEKLQSDVIIFSEMKNKNIINDYHLEKKQLIEPDYIFQINRNKNVSITNLLNKIEKYSIKLSNLLVVSTGLKVYQIGKGKPPQTDLEKSKRIFHSSIKHDNDYGKYLEGADVARYRLGWSGEYLKYGDWIAEPRKSVPFSGERILVRQIPSKLPYSINAVYTDEDFFNDINSMVIFKKDDHCNVSIKYVLGLLNSRLITIWFYYYFDKLQRNIFPQFKVNELGNFPIFPIIHSSKKDVERHDAMVRLVEQMLELNKRLQQAKTPDDKEMLSKQINITDRQIDGLVYELYELTPDEIAIVEESTK